MELSVPITIVVVMVVVCFSLAAGLLDFVNDTKWRVRAVLRYLLRPTVYICELNGIYGVVRARDYNRASRDHWWSREKYGHQCYVGWEMGPRFHIQTKILFGEVLTKYPILTGDQADLLDLIRGCRVEQRSFEMPSRWNRHPAETNVRFLASYDEGQRQVYTLAEAQELIHGRLRKRILGYLGTPFD